MKNKTNKKTSLLMAFFLMSALFLSFLNIKKAGAMEVRSACETPGGGGTWDSVNRKCTCSDLDGVKRVPNDTGYCAYVIVNNAYENDGGGAGSAAYLPGAGSASQGQTLFNQSISATPISNYILLEQFPGFFNRGDTLTDLPKLILAIYKFGIWTIGIAGLFMLVVGGFMYMTSAGNTSSAGNARGIIADSLVGIIAALAAYLLLYVINPDLTKIDISFTAVDVAEFGGPTGSGNPEPASASCKTDAMLGKIKTASAGKLEPCLTFAMLNTESGCTANAESKAVPEHACGIAQILPSTAGISCDALKSNVDLSITKGVKLLYSAMGSGQIRGNVLGTGNDLNQAIKDIYASYNGGMGALGASKDCDSSMKNSYGFTYLRWDCPIKPGKSVETVAATARFLNSYATCKSDPNIQGKLR